jgi:signal transduction histidine kinase
MRRQLALVMLATTSLVVLSLLIPLAKATSAIPRGRALSNAELTSQALVQAVVAVRDPVQLQRLVEQTSDLNGGTVSMLLPDGTTFGPAFPQSPAISQARLGRSLSAPTNGGVEVLTPARLQSGTAVVRVVVPDLVLRRGVRQAWLILAGLGVVLVLLAVMIADRLARSIVKPIAALAATTRALAQGNLDERVFPAGPSEVREVGETLNLLAERMSELLVTEREAIADLSHRLRTPISALRLDAEAITDPADAHRVSRGVEELTLAVDRLIRTARQPTQTRSSSCDVISVLFERSSFWAPLAEDQGRTFEVKLDSGPLWVGVDPETMSAAIDVLIDNVFTHTNEGIWFILSAQKISDSILISIDDAGNGVIEGLDERGVSGSGSTGLGLSIARSTASQAHGAFRLVDSALGGTRVEMELPLLSVR